MAAVNIQTRARPDAVAGVRPSPGAAALIRRKVLASSNAPTLPNLAPTCKRALAAVSRQAFHTKKQQALIALLLEWFALNARDLPWRRTLDPYAIWVSEIMLQQTQVKTVLPYWERWMKALPSIPTLTLALPQKIHKLWEGLGYYARVRNMQKAAQLIVEKYGGIFPERFESVLELPGIGRYTAGAICSIAFNQPKAILDGNVMRVLARLFGIANDTREKKTNARLWRIAEQLVIGASRLGHDSCSHLNQALMELGALVCTPKQPRCDACPVATHCVAFQENKVDRLPRRTRRPLTTRRNFAAFIINRNGQVLVRQRPAQVVNAHLWEFPNVELALDEGDLSAAAEKELGIKPVNLDPFCTINHSITRYRIRLRAFEVRGNPSARLKGRWLKPAQLALLPFCSAHSKILQLMLRPSGGVSQSKTRPIQPRRRDPKPSLSPRSPRLRVTLPVLSNFLHV